MYYKVVYRSWYDKKLTSYAGRVRNSKFCVEYRVGEWVTPTVENTKLYVFNDLENAFRWVNQDSGRDSNVMLFECKVKNPIRDFQVGSVFGIEEFWSQYFGFRQKHKKIQIESYKNIPGTTGCSAVKLTKSIPIRWSC